MKPTLNAPLSSILPELPRWTALSLPVLKDVRVAAAPAAWGIAILMFVAILLRQPLGIIVLAVHSFACSAIASIIAGQDFLYRTASWNMALPISRQQVWRQRMLIAGLAMLPVILVAFLMDWFPLFLFSATRYYVGPQGWINIVTSCVEPSVTALCLAPWLTLISRSALFGTIFSIGTQLIVFVFSSFLFEFFGFEDPHRKAATFGMYAMPCIWIFGAVMGWRKFMTLEAIEGIGGKTASASRRGALQRTRRRPAVWQLFKKEIMLQRFPLGLAALAMGLMFLLNKEQGAMWTLVYPAAIVIIMASVSCAEERQLGTVEWQVLLPIAYWKQWLAKFFVTYSLAAIVGVAMPLLLARQRTNEMRTLEGVDLVALATVFGAGLFMFVVITMYVSSLCSSGIKAVMAAIWVNVLAAYLIAQSFEGYATILWNEGVVTESPYSGDWWLDAHYWPFLLSVFGLVSLAMIFAIRNHRSAERGVQRVLRQLLAFAAYQAIVMIGVFTFWNWYAWLH